MKNILVTTDLSDESVRAFETSLEYAKVFQAKIYLLAVIEDPAQAAFAYSLDFPVLPDPDIHKQVMEKIRGDLKEMADKYFSTVANEFVVEEASGAIHAAILDFARKRSIDLIIMATHGRSGLTRMLIGSVAERVIRETDRPVLVVPSKK